MNQRQAYILTTLTNSFLLSAPCSTTARVCWFEHNLDVLKTADYLIDLGPEGGIGGGEIVATGTPEEIVKVEKSYTGNYLKDYLKNSVD